MKTKQPRMEAGPGLLRGMRRHEFVAIVSHELRTPLASIIAFTDTLRQQHSAKERRVYLDAIARNSQRILTTVEGLISVAGPGAAARRPQPCGLGVAVKLAMDMLKPAAMEGDVRLRVAVPSHLRVLAHPADLPHVLDNLIGNAVKYTKPGGQVVVSAERQDAHVALSVADTGVGIPAECLPKIFDCFYRSPKTSELGGSGLGLAIVRRLAAANGGSVSVQSQEGRGTTVRVVLPAA